VTAVNKATDIRRHALWWTAILVRISPLVAAAGVAGSAVTGGPVAGEIVDGLRARPNIGASLHVLAMVVLTADALIGASALVRHMRCGARLAREVRRRSVPWSANLRRVAPAVTPDLPLIQIDDDDRTAFTYGLFRPRVVVTTALVNQLSDRQLTAVLVHEEAHVDGLDPLRALAVACFGRALLQAPAMRSLLRCHLHRRELAADRAAVRVVGRSALVEALLAVLTPAVVAAGVSGGAALSALVLNDDDDLLRARILQLETGETVRPQIPAWQLLASAPAVLLFVGIALTCGPH